MQKHTLSGNAHFSLLKSIRYLSMSQSSRWNRFEYVLFQVFEVQKHTIHSLYFLKKYFSEFLMYSGVCCCLVWLLANVSYQLYNSRIFPITPGLEVNILCCKLPCLYWGRGKSLSHNTLQPLQQNSFSLWIYNSSLYFSVNAIE